jgi:glyoxylase-like metal-dependent hydrolase (beta-lactamase superfamily II)
MPEALFRIATGHNMNTLEHQLEYPFGDVLPGPGQPHEVSPGVFWIRMPLPFALDHINLWLLRDELDGQPGWTIVDCGVASDETKALWERIFDDHLQGLPVLRVVVTHCHPDHLGLAEWLCSGGTARRWSARLWISLGEYTFGKLLATGDGSNAGGPNAAKHFERHGLADCALIHEIRSRSNYYARLVPALPSSYRRLRDGDVLLIGGRSWRIVVGYGHSPEHCALYCDDARLLISGDMVLPRISTNVSVFDIEPEGNPLALYLESLGRYASMHAEATVLPSHGKPFRGLRTRLTQLREHHAARLAEVLSSCAASDSSAADLLPVLFRRPLDAHQTTFALGEALAHLHLLWHEGTLSRLVRNDGKVRFVTKGGSRMGRTAG